MERAVAVRTLVLGGGLVGSAVAHHTDGLIAQGIRWGDTRTAIADLRLAVLQHRSQGGQWSIAWCAGAGIVASAKSQLDDETRMLSAVLDAIGETRSAGRFLFTSSGGGMHGGNLSLRINENTVPAPTSPYGWAKWEQENLVAQWAERTSNAVVIARPSNVYGPGQRLSKPQGFISQLLWKIVHKEPLTLSVPWSTQRDFIYADDAGRRMAFLLANAQPGVNRRIVASGRSVTLSHVVAVSRQITGVNPDVIVTEDMGVHPAVLRFGTVHEPFDPQIPLKRGMMETWDYLLNVARHPARGAQ